MLNHPVQVGACTRSGTPGRPTNDEEKQKGGRRKAVKQSIDKAAPKRLRKEEGAATVQHQKGRTQTKGRTQPERKSQAQATDGLPDSPQSQGKTGKSSRERARGPRSPRPAEAKEAEVTDNGEQSSGGTKGERRALTRKPEGLVKSEGLVVTRTAEEGGQAARWVPFSGQSRTSRRRRARLAAARRETKRVGSSAMFNRVGA